MDLTNLESLNYDPITDLVHILKGQEDMPDFSFKELINTTKLYKNYVNSQLSELGSLHSDSLKEHDDKDKSQLRTDFDSISQKLREFHETNFNTMNHIRDLQKAKENLKDSINYYEVLDYVDEEFLKITDMLKREDYVSIKAVFNKYTQCLDLLTNKYTKITDEKTISKFNGIYDTLELRVKKYTKQLFQEKESIEIEQVQFQALFQILQCFKDETILKNIELWIIDNNVLFEFKQIFNVNDEVEVTSLENLERRFIFFKKLLSNFISSYEESENSWFPLESEMSIKIAKRFCKISADDLSIILEREFVNTNGSEKGSSETNLFMDSLEKCLEFEKYIKLKFKNKVITDQLSSQFKPYISIWISKQEDTINKNLTQYLANPKMSDNGSKDMIIPSSMELFRSYKTILNEFVNMISLHDTPSRDDEDESIRANDKMLAKLAKIYHHGISKYQTQIIEPLVIKDYKATLANTKLQDIIDYTVLVINTCDYIVSTVDDMCTKLQDYCTDDKYKEKIDNYFNTNKQSLKKLITSNITLILMDEIIKKELEFVFKEFKHVKWGSTPASAITNRYVSSLTKILGNEKSCSLIKITNLFYKEVYIYNLYDKVVNYIAQQFLESMIHILTNMDVTLDKRAEVLNQWSADMNEIVEFLSNYPLDNFTNISATHNGMKRCSETSKKELTSKVLNFVQLLSSDDLDVSYTNNFEELTSGCNNSVVWINMLELRGITEKSKIVDLWKTQAVGENFISTSDNWFVFSMSKTLQNTFIDYNNGLYAETLKLGDADKEWKNFLVDVIKVAEFKRLNTSTQKRVISPTSNSSSQQGLQQKIGKFWSGI
ncbi:hypothetical protein ACO0OL_000822 [Hanseniaspora opuntiae]